MIECSYVNKKSFLVHQYGIKIKIIGNLSLLPANVQQVAYKVMEDTKHHKG